MNTLRLIVSSLVIVLSVGFALSERHVSVAQDNNHVEQYQYEAVPRGSEKDKEEINAVISFNDNGIVISSKKISRKAEERMLLNLTAKGELISGTRTINSPRGSTETHIWRDQQRAYIERTLHGRKETRAVKIPEGSKLAVEGSLVVLLRSFPYDSATEWNLFMIDFSGRSIRATARQTGTECITVPAGEFSCYRIEIFFGVPFFRQVLCWFAMEEPHILVKSVGKRGPFTATYVTSLIGQQLPESPTMKGSYSDRKAFFD
jgi:hypothetical protein